MARVSFGSRAGRIRTSSSGGEGPAKSADEVIRELKQGLQKPPGEDYRDRSLAIHGLVCARCGREFDQATRHLLTVHHKDHNHHNNPPDGSNWENLCVYCHDDAHSRSVLGEYVDGASKEASTRVAYEDPGAKAGGGLADLLQRALAEKAKKGGEGR
jgi:hypothetical protein